MTGVPTSMLSNVDVIAAWTGASGNVLRTSNRISITPAVQKFNTTTYISTVVFDTLITGNQGIYTCQANINPSGSLMSIIDHNMDVNAQITLDIERELDLSVFSYSAFRQGHTKGLKAYNSVLSSRAKVSESVTVRCSYENESAVTVRKVSYTGLKLYIFGTCICKGSTELYM